MWARSGRWAMCEGGRSDGEGAGHRHERGDVGESESEGAMGRRVMGEV